MAAQASEIFTVVLRSTDGLDGFVKRTLALSPGNRIVIGRASKNPQKMGLMTSASNAFIDSPVISREHAIITAELAPPNVYISDNASMHGTLLNGTKLQPKQPFKLKTGDMLQFGQDVSRDKDQFFARKFTFEATPPDTSTPTSFSHGFTVPDVDTSEDEDEDAEVEDDMNFASSTAHLPYGSKMRPVTIADDGPEHSDSVDVEEVTMFQDTADVNAGPANYTPAVSNTLDELHEEIHEEIHEIHEVLHEASPQPSAASWAENSNLASSNVDEEDSLWGHFEDDCDSIDSYDPNEDDELDGCPLYDSSDSSSTDPNMASSESVADTDSPEDDGDDNEEDTYTDLEKKNDANCRMKLKTMLNHQAEMSTPQPESSTVEQSSELAGQDTAAPQEDHGQPSHETMFKPESIPSVSELVYEDSFTHQYSSWQTQPLPLVRAEPSKLASWAAEEYVSPYTPRDRPLSEQPSTHEQNFFTTWAPTYSDNPLNSSGTIPPLRPYSGQPVQSQLLNYSLPVKPLSSSVKEDIADRSTEQPTRRFKVSIPEIVEDVVQQPPTPTSESESRSGKLKRKADVLDEDTEPLVTTSLPQNVAAATDPAPMQDNVEVAIATQASSVAVPDGRPKKRLRKALGGAVKTVAGLLLPGTALAVGILTQLPSEFWTS